MPLWLLALIYFFFLTLVLSIWAALGDGAAVAALMFVSALLVLIALKSALIIEIDDVELRVGRAHIEIGYLAEALALKSKEMQIIRTRDADPAAYLGIRFWVSSGVRINIDDPRDATPYWLISTNNGEALTKILNSN